MLVLEYPNNFLNHFHSLDLDNNKDYENGVKEDFQKVFEERFAGKPPRKISSERMKDIALCCGGIAAIALLVGIVAIGILFGAVPVALISLCLAGYVVSAIELSITLASASIVISGIAAAVFGISGGIFYCIGKYNESADHKSKEYCIEQANQAVEKFLESKKTFGEFYKEHKNLFDAGIIKMEDMNILLRRKINKMTPNELVQLAKNGSYLFKENKNLLQDKIQQLGNIKVV